MVASLSKRGPDDEGIVGGDSFALGFRRLAIVATEFGHQPVSDPTRSVTLAFNGEIYNFGELALDLWQRRGVRVKCEAEALVALYLAEGLDFTRSIDGDYAIVVCDDRTRQCHLFRDPFGVKPLYYAPLADGSTWAAASEVQAFFRHPDFETDWDEIALWERCVLGFSASDRTNFAAIRQVPPGARVTLGATGPPCVIGGSTDPGEPRLGDLAPSTIADECAAVLRRAVERRISHTEHFPVAIALSGGVDSTIIAGLAMSDPGARVVGITIGEAPDQDDGMFAARVAASLALPQMFDQVCPETLSEHLPQIVLACGAQGPAYAAYFLGAAIRRHFPGAKVALCGEGADELFLGYWMHVRPQAYVDRAVSGLSTVPADAVDASPLLQVVAGWRSKDLPLIQRELNTLFRTHQLVNRHLIPFDHGMMAHGIECRVPFLDREVARFVSAVPEGARTAGNTAKVLLRLVASDVLRPFGADLERLVLDRRPSPLLAAMNEARLALTRRVSACLSSIEPRHSRLSRFAVGPQELHWLAAVDTIFLRHRAVVEGLELPEMETQILDAASR